MGGDINIPLSIFFLLSTLRDFRVMAFFLPLFLFWFSPLLSHFHLPPPSRYDTPSNPLHTPSTRPTPVFQFPSPFPSSHLFLASHRLSPGSCSLIPSFSKALTFWNNFKLVATFVAGVLSLSRDFKKPRRQRQRKRRLKISVRVTCTTWWFFQFVQLVQCGRTIQ